MIIFSIFFICFLQSDITIGGKVKFKSEYVSILRKSSKLGFESETDLVFIGKFCCYLMNNIPHFEEQTSSLAFQDLVPICENIISSNFNIDIAESEIEDNVALLENLVLREAEEIFILKKDRLVFEKIKKKILKEGKNAFKDSLNLSSKCFYDIGFINLDMFKDMDKVEILGDFVFVEYKDGFSILWLKQAKSKFSFDQAKKMLFKNKLKSLFFMQIKEFSVVEE